MFKVFLLIFFSTFLAQIGDKTQLITLLLATKTKKHFLLFLGVMIAFFFGVGIAVVLGAQLNNLVPHTLLKIIAGSIFILLGLFLLLKNRGKKKNHLKFKPHNQLLSTIAIIFLADFGDKTQIALALFSASYHPMIVFLAGLSALGLATLLTIYFSKIISRKLKEHIIEKLAGIVFIIVGIFLIL